MSSLVNDLDRAAHVLLTRAFPVKSDASETEGVAEQPDLSDQVKAFTAVSAYHISKSKHLPPEKTVSPFDEMRRELHGTGAKRRGAAPAAPANDSAADTG